jgi:hypothetical protein
MVMLVMGVNDGVMVLFIFVVGNVVMALTGVIGGAIVVTTLVIADMPNLVNGGMRLCDR